MANYKGGYAIIDCKSKTLGGTAVTIPGIYEALESQNGKPIMLQNYSVNGTFITSAFVSVVLMGSMFHISDGINNFVVNDDDEIIKVDYKSNDVITLPKSGTVNAGDIVVISDDGKIETAYGSGKTDFDGVAVAVDDTSVTMQYRGNATVKTDGETIAVGYFIYFVDSDNALTVDEDNATVLRLVLSIDTENDTAVIVL